MTPALRLRRWLGALAITSLAAGMVVGSSTADPSAGPGSRTATRAAGGQGVGSGGRLAGGSRPTGGNPRPSGRPNIVFVLTDDLSLDLLRYMPAVRALQQRGISFSRYFVSDSLCCPSRASIFTGDLPHDTHVIDNTGRRGGFHVFHRRGEERRTFAVALHRAGYRTAMMGKYLNGYLQDGSAPVGYVPPGWSDWDAGGWGYPEFGYDLNENGVLHRFGHAPPDYLTDVLASRGVDFIGRATTAGQPFFLELATFAPHRPYTPAPRDARLFPGLSAPRPASFDRLPRHAPRWLARRPPLTPAQLRVIDAAFRRRAQAVQAVDDLITRVEAALQTDGVARDTYVVFSSDNGLHTGEYRLTPGKMTAFDTDIRVPLVVAGPGIRAGSRTAAISENIDLAKTFAAIGGAHMSGDGHSLLELLHGRGGAGWAEAALVEHHGPALRRHNPDFQRSSGGNPNSYAAIRGNGYLYVEYRDGEREFYDLRRDPFELDNLAGRLSLPSLLQLHLELARMRACHTGGACWAAMHVGPVAMPPPG